MVGLWMVVRNSGGGMLDGYELVQGSIYAAGKQRVYILKPQEVAKDQNHEVRHYYCEKTIQRCDEGKESVHRQKDISRMVENMIGYAPASLFSMRLWQRVTEMWKQKAVSQKEVD